MVFGIQPINIMDIILSFIRRNSCFINYIIIIDNLINSTIGLGLIRQYIAPQKLEKAVACIMK
ncbi:hypothetical protein BK704_17565 [[Bacillus thuringiensis] serovar konkukian]|nr:hypothetical protein BK704_17565 [[Bacillus thuringiensis] serovar konkukian]